MKLPEDSGCEVLGTADHLSCRKLGCVDASYTVKEIRICHLKICYSDILISLN